MGYPAERIVVIPNGIDTERFQFDRAGRHRVRDEWRIAPDELLIGLAARLDPMKDQANFLEAVAKVRKALPSVRFACVGSGSPALTNALRSHAERLGLADIGVWSGTRHDMPAVYSAFDIAVSSAAFGEGFSNAIAEAMACQRLCVVTDVGDSGWIVGDTGAIVPSRDPQAMCSALLNLARSVTGPSLRSGVQARARINELFNVRQLAERTISVLGETSA